MTMKNIQFKYFVRDDERKGTCYHEFHKGKWDEQTFWKEDSIFLHDDVKFQIEGFTEALLEIIPSYDPFGETEITEEIWRQLGKIIDSKDTDSQELYYELDLWLKEVFQDYDCITILGI